MVASYTHYNVIHAHILYGSREGQFSTQLSFRNLRACNLRSTSLFARLNLARPLHITAVHCYLIVIVLK